MDVEERDADGARLPAGEERKDERRERARPGVEDLDGTARRAPKERVERGLASAQEGGRAGAVAGAARGVEGREGAPGGERRLRRPRAGLLEPPEPGEEVVEAARGLVDGAGRAARVEKRPGESTKSRAGPVGAGRGGAEDLVQAAASRQKIDSAVFVVRSSRAIVPAREFPFSESPGDQTVATNFPGSTATTPPPTPLLAGRPTR